MVDFVVDFMVDFVVDFVVDFIVNFIVDFMVDFMVDFAVDNLVAVAALAQRTACCHHSLLSHREAWHRVLQIYNVKDAPSSTMARTSLGSL